MPPREEGSDLADHFSMRVLLKKRRLLIRNRVHDIASHRETPLGTRAGFDGVECTHTDTQRYRHRRNSAYHEQDAKLLLETFRVESFEKSPSEMKFVLTERFFTLVIAARLLRKFSLSFSLRLLRVTSFRIYPRKRQVLEAKLRARSCCS